MNELSQYSDEELKSIAGQSNDVSSMSDDELMRIAGGQPSETSNELSLRQGKEPSFIDKAWSFFDDPAAVKAKATLAIVDSEALNIHPSLAYDNKKAIDKYYNIDPERKQKKERTLQAIQKFNDTGIRDGWAEVFWKNIKQVPVHLQIAAGGLLQAIEENVDPEVAMNMNGAIPDEATVKSFELAREARDKKEVYSLGREVAEAGQKKLEKEPINVFPGSFKETVGMATQSTANNLLYLIPGFAWGRSIPLFMMGTQAMGESYVEQRKGGSSSDTALTASFLKGLSEAGTEFIPMGIYLKPNAGFVKRLVEAEFSEIPTEIVNTMVSDVIDKSTIRPDMTIDDALENIQQTIQVTALSSFALTGFSHSIHKAIAKTLPKDQKQIFADASKEVMDNGGTARQASKAGIDAVSSTPEGKAHIDNQINKMKQEAEKIQTPKEPFIIGVNENKQGAIQSFTMADPLTGNTFEVPAIEKEGEKDNVKYTPDPEALKAEMDKINNEDIDDKIDRLIEGDDTVTEQIFGEDVADFQPEEDTTPIEKVEPTANVEGESDKNLPQDAISPSIQRIKEKVSMRDFRNIIERYFPQVREAYSDQGIYNVDDYLEKLDTDIIDMEISSDQIPNDAIRKLLGGDEFAWDEVDFSDIIDMYKKKELAPSIDRASFKISDQKIENIPVKGTQNFYETTNAKQNENVQDVYNKASQRVTDKNRTEINEARKKLFLAWATDAELHKKLNISKAELNKKIKTYTGANISDVAVQNRVNEGIPNQFHWTGVTNSNYINKTDISLDDVDSVVAKIDDNTQNRRFGSPDGTSLRRYIMNTLLAIDTRLKYDDLNFIINHLEKALGEYSNKNLTITISSGSQNTVAHEIGHYLDYRFAREMGLDLRGLSDGGYNFEYIKEKHNLSDEHIKWAKEFIAFIDNLRTKGEIGHTADRADYLQRPTEVFARFIAKFVDWTSEKSGFKHHELNYYSDRFDTNDYYNFIKLLQKKAELDSKYNIKPIVKGAGEDIPAQTTPQAEAGKYEDQNKIIARPVKDVGLNYGDQLPDNVYLHGSKRVEGDIDNFSVSTSPGGTLYLTKNWDTAEIFSGDGRNNNSFIKAIELRPDADIIDLSKSTDRERLSDLIYEASGNIDDEVSKKQFADDLKNIDFHTTGISDQPEYGEILYNENIGAIKDNFGNVDVISDYAIKTYNPKQLPNPSRPPEVGGQSTLYSGVDITQTLDVLRGLKGNIKEAMPHLEALGSQIYQSGKTKFNEWSASMKETLGDLWESFKDILKEVYEVAKRKLAEERGSFSNRDAVNADPLFDIVKYIKERGGLNYDSLIVDWGKEDVGILMKKRPGVVKKDGVLKLDEVAQEWDTNDNDLMMDLLSNKSKKDLISKLSGKAEEKYLKEIYDNETVSRWEFNRAVNKARIAFQEGNAAELKRLKNSIKWMAQRKSTLKNVRDYFGLTDEDMSKISRKNPLLMDEQEFAQYLKEVNLKAIDFKETQFARAQLIRLIEEKRLQKVDNYRRALELPSISEMTTDQLRKFAKLLEPFKNDDVFLTQRELETVDRTVNLQGVKTWREAKVKLLDEVNRMRKSKGMEPAKMEDLTGAKVAWNESFKWDASLREQDPFFDLLVTRMTEAMTGADLKIHNIESTIFDLAKKSEKSRKRGIVERMIPKDELIFQYLEAPRAQKNAIAQQMTPEQLRLAHYMNQYFANYLDYLISVKSVERGRENYITHIRKSFMENVRDKGLKEGVTSLFTAYQEDAMGFNILDDSTGKILPLEKFFQYSLHRTGELDPSQNVIRVFMTYVRTAERKKMFDAIIPELDIYTQSLTPAKYTPRGLEYDRSLKTFVNKWINNKKGRKISYDSVIRQGGPLDLMIRGIRTFTTILDLGFSIPVGIASFVGEQVTDFTMLGVKNYTLGTARMRTDKGQRILKKYEVFTGRSFWEDFNAPGKQFNERISDAMFGLFHVATKTANKQFLLGMMSESEYKNEELTTERLADLKLEMGRLRVVGGTNSLIGSTSLGNAAAQYKTWAVPIVRTLTHDIGQYIKDLNKTRKGQMGLGDSLTTKEAKELYRMIGLTAVVLLVGSLSGVDDDDGSFIGKLKKRAYREATTLTQGIDPKLWFSAPRILSWLTQISIALHNIMILETYKTKDELKGVNQMKKALTPGIVRQLPDDEEE